MLVDKKQGFFCSYLDVDNGAIIHGSISTVCCFVLAARVRDGVLGALEAHPVARVHYSTAFQLHIYTQEKMIPNDKLDQE